MEELSKISDKEITANNITIVDIKEYICPNATDKELVFFFQLCKGTGLNPFLNEIYLIKPKSGDFPAYYVVSSHSYAAKAEENPQLDGMESGVVIGNPETREIIYRDGAMKFQNELLLGGWATVYRKDRKIPTKVVVHFDEIVQKTKDGTVNKQWRTQPCWMSIKVAETRAYKKAFPNLLHGMPSQDEVQMHEVNPDEQEDFDIKKLEKKTEPEAPEEPKQKTAAEVLAESAK